jgi:putative DNA primase/helicase
MVDEPIDPNVDGVDVPQDTSEQAPEAQSSALGAIAPQDGNVVKAEFGATARKRKGTEGSTSSAPPAPPKSAAAPSSGTGGEKAAAKLSKAAEKGKKERVVDWGKFNTLVEKFALIYGTDNVWDGGNRILMKIGNMAHAHGSDMVRMWKGSDKRRTVLPQDLVFDPTETCDEHCINIFGGIEMVPQAGDVAPMIDLIRFLTSRASDDEGECDAIMHWLLCWLAYPLQHVGTKLRTAVIMHGDEGAGKNFLFDLVVAIYGKYGALVGQDELEDKFNDWRSGKMFVVGDEVSSRAELVHNKNRLKALITSPTVQINPKNLARREEANHINIVFLSNELQPLALDNSDRRYLVIYTPRAKDFDYYRRLKEWRNKGGVAAFYDYLLNYPLEGFDPYAPAPFTKAKSDLIDINRKSPERFWHEWQGGQLDLPYQSCSMDQAYQAYLKYAQRTGDRFPMQRPVFTRMVLRFSETMDRPATEKVMNITTDGARKSHRMFLVCEPNFGEQSQGEWATDSVRHFAEHLKVFLGWSPRSPGDGDEREGHHT